MHSPNEGGHGHDVGCHIWPIYILEPKIFGCHSIVFKDFVKLQMVHSMQQKLFKLMKVWTRYAFSKWRGHGDVGWWSLRFCDVTLLSFHFKKVCKASNNASIAF